MALTTRRLAIGTGALLLLVCVVVLPPRPCESGGFLCSGGYFRASSQLAVAERTRDRLRQALERQQLADSVLAQHAARGQIASASGITVHFEAPLSSDSARRWLALAERELAMIPGDGRGVPIHVVLKTAPSRTMAALDEPMSRWWYRPSLDRFAASAGSGACFVVIELHQDIQDVFVDTRRRGDNLLRKARPRLLDWCALYGRFGTPGPGVETWAASAFSFGWRDQASLAEMAVNARADSAREDDDYLIRACRAGADMPCLRYLGAYGVEPLAWWLPQRERSRDVLAWLVATSEPGQFAGFWRGRGSLEEALTSGYGRPAGAVLADWARARFAAPRRPTTAPKALLAGAFWFSLAMVAALVAMERRQAD